MKYQEPGTKNLRNRDFNLMLTDIVEAYGLELIQSVRVLPRSRHRLYIVMSEKGEYVIKVYDPQDISLASLEFQHGLLFSLKEREFTAAYPIRIKQEIGKSNSILVKNNKYVSLYDYLPGRNCLMNSGDSYRYGVMLGLFHNLVAEIHQADNLRVIDVETLISSPVEIIKPFLSKQPDELSFLSEISEHLKCWLNRLRVSDNTYGICHGDAHHLNAVFDKHGSLCLVDFEEVGLCWRMYDYATFLWGSLSHGGSKVIWESFRKGYTSVRPFELEESFSILPFIAVRHIWWLGLHAAYWGKWDQAWLDRRFFQTGIRQLRKIAHDLEILEMIRERYS